MFRVASITVEIVTVQEDTWVVTSQKSDDLLSHEQGHYDLTGLSGRDMANEMAAARARTPAALQARVSQIIRTYRRRAKAWTDSYDTETDHSRNRQVQSRWDERIRDAMQNGTSFAPA